jgi:hypothetical protein
VRFVSVRHQRLDRGLDHPLLAIEAGAEPADLMEPAAAPDGFMAANLSGAAGKDRERVTQDRRPTARAGDPGNALGYARKRQAGILAHVVSFYRECRLDALVARLSGGAAADLSEGQQRPLGERALGLKCTCRRSFATPRFARSQAHR